MSRYYGHYLSIIYHNFFSIHIHDTEDVRLDMIPSAKPLCRYIHAADFIAIMSALILF